MMRVWASRVQFGSPQALEGTAVHVPVQKAIAKNSKTAAGMDVHAAMWSRTLEAPADGQRPDR